MNSKGSKSASVETDLEPEHDQSFQTLKRSLTSSPVLAYPNAEDTFILDCDASNSTIGAELCHVQDGKERTIAYSSYMLTPYFVDISSTIC